MDSQHNKSPLLAKVRHLMPVQNYAIRTENACVDVNTSGGLIAPITHQCLFSAPYRVAFLGKGARTFHETGSGLTSRHPVFLKVF